MFKQKNALISLAVAVLLAACGGGGGGDTTGGGTAPDGGGNGGGNGGGGGTTLPETKLVGHLELASNQVLFNGTGQTLTAFTSTEAGGGVYGQAEGVDAPLKTFGLRVRPEGMNTPEGQNETVRVAVELLETADSAPTGQEEIQVLIDKVDFSIDPANAWSLAVPADARVHLRVKNAAGQTADIVAPATTDLVSVSTIDGDASSNGIIVDIEKAIAAARTAAQADNAKMVVLDTVKDFSGKFNMNATVSRIDLKTEAATGAPADLVGKSITVLDQTPVEGGGVQGFLWVKELPPGV